MIPRASTTVTLGEAIRDRASLEHYAQQAAARLHNRERDVLRCEVTIDAPAADARSPFVARVRAHRADDTVEFVAESHTAFLALREAFESIGAALNNTQHMTSGRPRYRLRAGLNVTAILRAPSESHS